MHFTVLPVNVGDSFLLRQSGSSILVDGGKNRSHIVKLLTQELGPTRHVNVLICTHYDADHVNGILSILRSQKFTFDEIWLPEILGSLSYTISVKL